MPPRIITLRHAQGEHNVDNKFWIRDAKLTPTGLSECAEVARTFPFHADVDLVVSSPLRRTIQTTVHSLFPILRRQGSDGTRKKVPFILHPAAQEVSGRACNLGSERAQLESVMRGWFSGAGKDGDETENTERIWNRCGLGEPGRVDFGLVGEGWCDKTGFSSPDPKAVEERAASLRRWLYQRPEKLIVLVTHGAFLHYFTQSWEGISAERGSAFKNCEWREYNFSDDSSSEAARIVETDASRKRRGVTADGQQEGDGSGETSREIEGGVAVREKGGVWRVRSSL
ncbi:uncharacterized protein AB675_388 [Cyphellophora attinorum]|uniref:Phosphatase SPAC5H10.03 n=1 Tax=Cyphellophora attinorum TaxID=1664694 RepID=A0A0N0NSC0_9EURO|nr:uncharacterized protein AB675_388 [Phialophora attinorum]KPI45829.1 hypothetical protein AB675_388 [Phialophora attinorum]